MTVEQQYAKRIAILRAAAAAQNEEKITTPKPSPRVNRAPNEHRNLYFGDTHVHTALSFDSYLTGNRLGLEDAYRFANGEALMLHTGESMQLSQPLDFVVITDHAEGFGLFVTCARDDLQVEQKEFCRSFDYPSQELFKALRKEAVKRPPARSEVLYGNDLARSQTDAQQTWKTIVETSNKYNQPGKFTAFAGYEYSPPLPKKGKIHRNVIFKNEHTPARAVSAFDAATELDLWNALEEECTGECAFLTIPHNMNKTWGLAYAGVTVDGDRYTEEDWRLRARNEPLAEIFQIKGNSECGFGVGASDEECNFELNVPICVGEQVPGCSGRTSFVREGLKIGMTLQSRLGINPIQTGFIGSTDSHNSSPGATEEFSFRGASGEQESPARVRLGLMGDVRAKAAATINLVKNPGGLAAVWARENSREEIFEAMQRRETYATSGTRIRLRVFAGWDYPGDLLNHGDRLATAYNLGVPMGGVLPKSKDKSARPQFLIWALKDPQGANLQKLQLVKAWVKDGVAVEEVFDIACSDQQKPDPVTGRCPDNRATVNIQTCEAEKQNSGDAMIETLWQDSNFDPANPAVYYVRVLENPGCRWSTYDAIRLEIDPLPDVPATIQERAWSSPIWYQPQ